MICLIVKGKVQGVFFRDFTKQMAAKFNITGYVRNLANGDVEIFARGDENSLKMFEDAVQRGSPSSRVDSVEKKLLNDQLFDGFEIRY
ncbi:MAG: acylphosphatase [Candidatus Aenigmatarchaeota archaeon]